MADGPKFSTFKSLTPPADCLILLKFCTRVRYGRGEVAQVLIEIQLPYKIKGGVRPQIVNLQSL